MLYNYHKGNKTKQNEMMQREYLDAYISDEDKKKVAKEHGLTIRSVEFVISGKTKKSPCLSTLLALAELNKKAAEQRAVRLKASLIK